MNLAAMREIKERLETVEEMSPAGFAIAFHVKLTSPEFLFQTYPKVWTDIYSEKGYVMVDPIVGWGFANIGAIRWSLLGDLDPENVIEQSRAYGMNFGVAISTETEESRSVAGFSHDSREFTDAEIDVLTTNVEALHALTRSSDGMPQELRDELHRLSIEMTHNTAT